MSHCGTFERALRQVAAAPSPRNTWTGARYARPAKVTATPTRWRPIARAIGAKVSCSRANGAQATEVDCVGVHAVAAENVWTRDPDVDPTMRFLSRKLRPFGCRPAAVGRDASWTAIAQSGSSTALSMTGRRKMAFGAAVAATPTWHLVCRERFW